MKTAHGQADVSQMKIGVLLSTLPLKSVFGGCQCKHGELKVRRDMRSMKQTQKHNSLMSFI
jgi:hypothetical protein